MYFFFTLYLNENRIHTNLLVGNLKQIYLDYASTTPVEGVVKKMTDFMSFDGNFESFRSHSFGWKADEAVEEARNNLATLIGCDQEKSFGLQCY